MMFHYPQKRQMSILPYFIQNLSQMELNKRVCLACTALSYPVCLQLSVCLFVCTCINCHLKCCVVFQDKLPLSCCAVVKNKLPLQRCAVFNCPCLQVILLLSCFTLYMFQDSCQFPFLMNTIHMQDNIVALKLRGYFHFLTLYVTCL